MQEWLKSLWDTPEGLAKIFYWTQWAIAVFGIATAVAVVLSVVVTKRRDEIIALSHEQSEHHRDEQIAVANEAARKAREGQENARAAQEQAEAKIRGLEQAAADRHLTKEQGEIIEKILQEQPPYRIFIRYLIGVKDSPIYAQDIGNFLAAHGWNVTIGAAAFGPDTQGVLLWYSASNNGQVGAMLLKKAFAAAGITAQVKGITTDPFSVILEVGTK